MASIYQPPSWGTNMVVSSGTTWHMDLANPGVKVIYATVDGLALFIATQMDEEPDDLHFELADAILQKYGQEPKSTFPDVSMKTV